MAKEIAHQTFVVTLSSGKVQTRSSKTRAYTHAVEGVNPRTGQIAAFSWHSTKALAQKEAGSYAANGWKVLGVVPVVGYPYSSAEAKAARAAEKARQS